MIVSYNELPFPHVIIENMYDDQELDGIWTELNFYKKSPAILRKDEWGNGDGKVKNNFVISLDRLYQDRNYSIILDKSRKLWNKEIVEACANHWGLQPIQKCDLDFTLVSYYPDGSYYNAHRDKGNVTAITHLFEEPKQFSGGDLTFPEYNMIEQLRNNQCIIFPSSIQHSVTPVTGEGRWAISQFLRFLP